MKLHNPNPRHELGISTMTIPTIAVIGEILANGYIIWFLLIDLPSRCARIAVETGGRQTCETEAGASVIATASAVLILTGIYYLASWYIPRKE